MSDALTRLAAKHKSDKGLTVFPFHGYTLHYARLFEPFRNEPISVLEIGLARRTDRSNLIAGCPSLSMWLEYFPSARVYGFDIDDFSTVRLPRTRIFRGDQGNPNDLLRVVAECPQFDLIIDDGSHASYHQQITLKTLFPYLSPQGLYIIEDLLWQPSDLEAAFPTKLKTRDLLKNPAALSELIPGGAHVQFLGSPIQPGHEGMAVLKRRN